MKKLSIIITGRNDNYLEDFIFKTSYVLNHTLHTIYKHKLEKYFKIIFVDWGSKKLLSDSLFIDKKYRKSIEFYYVPSKVEKMELDYKRRINTSKAHNLGIRKSNTEFCLLSHSDQIYPSFVLKNLKNFVTEKIISKEKLNNSYLYIPRKYLSHDFFKNYPSDYLINRYFDNLNFSGQKWKNPSFIIGGGWGGILAKKKIFLNLEGLKEDYYINQNTGQVSPDLDFHQRSSLQYSAIDASNYGIYTYRFFNPQKNDNREKFIVKRLPPKNLDKKQNPKWGLKKFNIKRKKITNDKKILINQKNKLQKFELRKHLKFIAAISKKYKMYSFNLENIYIYFIISYFKIYGYLEIFVEKDTTFKIISDIFNGIESYKVNLSKNSKNQNINREFNTLNSMNKVRVGYTKVCSYKSNIDCLKIFNLTPKEKNTLLVNIEFNKQNNHIIIKELIKNESKIAFLIVKNNSQIEKKLLYKFKSLLIKKEFSLLINKKLYNPQKQNFFDYLMNNKNLIKVIYTLFINLNRIK